MVAVDTSYKDKLTEIQKKARKEIKAYRVPLGDKYITSLKTHGQEQTEIPRDRQNMDWLRP